MEVLKKEYPRPQMVRSEWQNLNGEWEFEFDFGKSGREREIFKAESLEKKINVPFCPESRLSGIEYKDFINAAWYRRTFTVKKSNENERLLLNFEAVDYYCEVYINETRVGSHFGGYTPFTFDITKFVKTGENVISVYVEDDSRNPMQPRGKQAESFNSQGCDYTRVTGIWQTVWLETVPENHIKSYRCTPDVCNSSVNFDVLLEGSSASGTLIIEAFYNDKCVGKQECSVATNRAVFSLDLEELHLWQPLAAQLYDFRMSYTACGTTDTVCGYFGMRDIRLTQNAILINDKPVFQRLILDQGFYPDGIYTAPDDESLKRDIQLSMDLGFNGARMHQKVFERRYLYWADKLGYIVWGEYGNWGLDHSKLSALASMVSPWIEAVERDYNSPALVGWCPFNETWDYHDHPQKDEVIRSIYLLTKALDRTRPCIDTSGNFHVLTDIFDIHDYEQNVKEFAAHYEPLRTGGEPYNNFPWRQQYCGEPYFISEYGGILWNEKNKDGWGYGNAPKTVEEFAERYAGLAEVLLDNPHILGLCYTQLTDVEQEKNGLYYYDRTPKFSPEITLKLKNAMSKQATIEK